MTSISEQVRAHILATRPADKRHLELTDTGSLVRAGILDSVGVFTLVAFLEQTFHIEVPDEELTWTNFESVAAITRFVTTKLAAARAL